MKHLIAYHKAEKMGHEPDGDFEIEPELEFYNDLDDISLWPANYEAPQLIEGLSQEVADVIIEANDTRLKNLTEGSDTYKARQILEEVLIH